MSRPSARSLLLRLAAAVLGPCALAIAFSWAQQPAAAPVRAVIVLDPAHGGPDAGAKLGDSTLEKDVTLAFAARLKPALAAAGFSVVLTRESDVQDPLSTDQRAETANRQRALACLILHATPAGSGVHLYSSTLAAAAPGYTDADLDAHPGFVPTPWDEAQAPAIHLSLALQSHLYAAFQAAKLPVLRNRAPVRPLDNLTCPAIAVEIAPLAGTPVSDPAYQQRVADAVVSALRDWRDDPASHPAPPPRPVPARAPAAGANP